MRQEEKDVAESIQSLINLKTSLTEDQKLKFGFHINCAISNLELILLKNLIPVPKLSDKQLQCLSDEFSQFRDSNYLADLLFSTNCFRRSGLQSQINYDKLEMSQLMHWLTKHKLIDSTSVGFRKRPICLQLLRHILSNPYPEPVYQQF